jgi:hypothetical protein
MNTVNRFSLSLTLMLFFSYIRFESKCNSNRSCKNKNRYPLQPPPEEEGLNPA